MSKSINGIFMAGAAFLGLSACSDERHVDPIVAHCVRDNTNIELKDPKQRFKIINSQDGTPVKFTGEPLAIAHAGTTRIWTTLVSKNDEDGNPAYGWQVAQGDRFQVKLSDDGKEITQCQVGNEIYTSLDI